jgi:hypothetical protein
MRYLTWIKGLNQGLNTKNWMVLDRLPELKRQRHIQRFTFLTERDSFKIIKELTYRIFTGLTQRTITYLLTYTGDH